LAQAQLLRRHRYLVGFALVHLLLILLVCVRDACGIFAEASTIFPASLAHFWNEAAALTSTALAEDLTLQNPLRNAVALYLNGAGVEAGYGFYAPNVPSNYKLVFELQYADGRREYDLPALADAATAFRLESLLDRVAEIEYEPMRQAMVRTLTYPTWRRHPEAVSIRTVLGYSIWPSPDEYRQGKRGTLEPVYSYDFDLRSAPAGSTSPP
jgi:hypothetical protein